MNTPVKDSEYHGRVLADLFGCSMQFVKTTVMTGSSETDVEETSIAVYPKKYVGMGGGMMKAAMDGAPVFDFTESEAAEADCLVEALNHFAEITKKAMN